MGKRDVVFYDRRGAIKAPDAHSVIKPRRGAWVIAKAPDAVLFIWPTIVKDVPDLPGGGLEAGETHEQAARREWTEETGLPFTPTTGILGTYHHVRGFCPQDVDEYWIYDQTFFLYGYERQVEIGQKWLTPEGDQASWESIGSLAKLPVNRTHWLAVEALMPEIKGMGQ